MRCAYGVGAERRHEIEPSRVWTWKWEKRQVASIRKDGNGDSVDRQGRTAVPNVAKDEARIASLDHGVRRWVLDVNPQRTFDQGNGRQARCFGRRRGRRRAGPPRGACGERCEKRDTSGASREGMTQHEVKLTAPHERGETVMVCRASPAFLYWRGNPIGRGAPPGGNVTTQPPETSILYGHPRSTTSPPS